MHGRFSSDLICPAGEVDILNGFKYSDYYPVRKHSSDHLFVLGNNCGRRIGRSHPLLEDNTKLDIEWLLFLNAGKACFKGPLSNLRQFLITESPWKMMKNVFYFMLKAPFVLEIFTFFSWVFGCLEKNLDKKFKVNSEIYDVTDRTKNNSNMHIAQYLKK